MFEYDIHAQRAAEELDKYNFTDLLRYCYENGYRNPWDIADVMIAEHNELGVEDGAIDWLSIDELIEYLSERYNVAFEEVITYRMWYKE